jgi:peroxin-2
VPAPRSLLERLVGARLVYRQATMTRIISFEYLNRQLVWQEVSELLLFLLPLLDGLRARGTLSRLLPRLPDPRAVLAQGSAAVVAAISSGVARVAGGAAGGQQESLTGSTSTTGVEGGAQGGAQGASGTPTPAGSPVAGTSGKEASKGGTEARQPQQQVQQQAGAGAGMERQGSTASTVVPVTRPTGPCPVCGTQEPLLPLLAVPCGHCFCYYCLAARTAANRQFACPLDGVRVAAMERWRPGRKVTSVLA